MFVEIERTLFRVKCVEVFATLSQHNKIFVGKAVIDLDRNQFVCMHPEHRPFVSNETFVKQMQQTNNELAWYGCHMNEVYTNFHYVGTLNKKINDLILCVELVNSYDAKLAPSMNWTLQTPSGTFIYTPIPLKEDINKIIDVLSNIKMTTAFNEHELAYGNVFAIQEKLAQFILADGEIDILTFLIIMADKYSPIIPSNFRLVNRVFKNFFNLLVKNDIIS